MVFTVAKIFLNFMMIGMFGRILSEPAYQIFTLIFIVVVMFVIVPLLYEVLFLMADLIRHIAGRISRRTQHFPDSMQEEEV